MSWEAFERLADDGTHHELLEGALQTLPPPKSGHSNIASNTFKALLSGEQQGLGRVYLEAGYKLSSDPATWVQPDVSFLAMERVRATPADGYFLGSQDLAVEVVSPSESARDLERKVELLLRYGSAAVWVLYPDSRRVWVYLANGTSFSRGIGDSLSVPCFPAGWEIPVAQLFAG